MKSIRNDTLNDYVMGFFFHLKNIETISKSSLMDLPTQISLTQTSLHIFFLINNEFL